MTIKTNGRPMTPTNALKFIATQGAREDGIVLVVMKRCEDQAGLLAERVRQAGGDVWSVRKTRTGRKTGDKTWEVVFTLPDLAHGYVLGRVDLKDVPVAAV